jgi:amino acid adenylation domain-containing protein
MTLLWIALLPAAVTAAWVRYRQVVGDNANSHGIEPTLTQCYPATPWGTHRHQQGARWLHELFERSAAQFPSLTALSVPETGESLTYAKLDELANQFAAVIGDAVSKADQVVAVRLPQDSSTVVALHLAILKAGATQCFIDPDAPDELFSRVLSDARPALLISDESPAGYAGALLSPEDLLRQAESRPTRTPSAPWLDDPQSRLASLFYTSGTTGHPKGVECPHAGYINLAQSYATFYDFVPGTDASSLTSSLGYDGSISEMYSAWVGGCEVVLLTKSALRSGPDLLPVLRDAQVTALFCPPVLLSTLTAHPERDLPYPICRYIVPAGEAFPASLIEPWSRARRQVVNTYGPTEVSTDTSRQLLRPNEPVTIGSPFPGVSYTIVDPDTLTSLPHGEEGELCIGGVQLACGYRNLPEVTHERFMEHPELGRIYRSGDRCHVDPNSLRVHFHGRIDAQLKVRGYRVEAQPIESLLQDQFADIETAVLDCQDNELVALLRAPVLWSQDTTATNIQSLNHGLVSEAQQLISARFPPYAVPSRFFVVNQFELVPASGKINRRALPSVADVVSFEATETAMITAFSDDKSASLPTEVLTLCRAELGPTLDWHDDFVDWGAHSIAIARLTQQLQSAGYPVSVRGLLSETRTAAAIAELPTQGDDEQESVGSTTGTHTGSEAHSEGDPQTVRSYGFRHFTALQAMAAVLLRVPLLLMAALGLAIIDPEELLLVGDIVGFLRATITAYCVYMVVPFVNLGWVLLLRSIQAVSVRTPRIAPGRYQKFSSHHLQLWWLEQQADFVLKPLVKGLRSPVLFNWALKRLGADVHPKAFIAQSTEWYGPLSLISIGPEAVVQAGVQISSARWERSEFILDTIHVGEKRASGAGLCWLEVRRLGTTHGLHPCRA